MKKYKNLILIFLAVTLFLTGCFLGSTHHESKSKEIMSGFKVRQQERDSIIAAYEVALKDMRAENDSLRVERDYYREEVDGTLVILKSLTKVKVTDETIEEALEWIEHYNDSL